MKINTNVKAGFNFTKIEYNNHNEKLQSDINTIEQKKSIGKKLRLSKETVRELKSSELKLAGGAISIYSRCLCTKWVNCE
jgi:hypothetical protein